MPLLNRICVAVLLLATSACGADSPATSPTPLSPSTTFAGNWTNPTAVPHGTGSTGQLLSSGFIPALVIGVSGDAVLVRAWGRCEPTDCDWGTAVATGPLSGPLTVQWNPSFAIETMVLSMNADGTLTATTHTHFIDGSGRVDLDEVDVFARCTGSCPT
jgi:hypothetical protein